MGFKGDVEVSIECPRMSRRTRLLLLILSFMTYEEINRRLDELAREYVATHNSEIVPELYRLARELEKMELEKMEKE